jgi:hypothetical protein
MTYHAIGDSNCLYNTFHLPRFTQHHLGSTRMRDVATGITSLGVPGPLDLSEMGIEPGDKCFFHLGAIDVRVDTHNQIAAGGCMEDTITTLVEQFLDVLKGVEIPDVEFWLVSLLPPPPYLSMPPEIRDHPIYPYIGTDAEIAKYTRCMNMELELQGNARRYQYLDIHTRYADAKGMMRPELASYMHVCTNAPILAEMHARGLYTDAEAGVDTGLTTLVQTMRECQT